jgi:hypothetical protein
VIPLFVRETFDYILLVYLLYRVMPCIKLLHFSFSDLQMMWPLMTDSWRKEAFELISAEVSKTFERLDPWVLLCGTHLCFFCVLLTALQKMTLHCFRFQWFHCFAGICLGFHSTGQVARFRGSPAIINYQVPFLHTGEATRTPSSSFHAAPPGIRPSRRLRGAPHEQGRARRRWDLLSKSIGLHDEPILLG